MTIDKVIMNPKISVIVAVYNARDYIERSITSLMEQSFEYVEFIIIDDGSTDNSFNMIKDIISRYPMREKYVTLISRENRGVAATRAQGMELSKGDYIIHLDSDDWASRDWLVKMYDAAIKNSADMVICDYFKVQGEYRELVKQRVLTGKIETIKQLLLGNISNSNCDKLINRALFVKNEIKFHGGYDMGEDFLVTLSAMVSATKIIHVDSPLYFYNKSNENSLTMAYSKEKLMDLIEIVKLGELFLKKNNLYDILQKELERFKLNVKALFIIHSNSDILLIKQSFSIFPSTNKLIFKSRMKTLIFVYIMKKIGLLRLCPLILNLRKKIRK